MDSEEPVGELEALRLVEQHLTRSISSIRRSRSYYRRGSQLQIVALTVLSAATTLLIALDQIYHRSVLAAAALGTGALMTVAASWASWFGFRRLWLANTATLVKLWALRDQIDFDKAYYGVHLTHVLIEGYHRQLQQIIAEHHHTWQQIRSIEQ
ncbi:MAG TPA: SLATT domain-containing protein [Streptosporangiaceae bacterium]|nr:SLATT domain-containing protein [Streptosporangiaceae bacterium]